MNLNRQYQGLLHTILSVGIQDGGRLYLPSMLINHRMEEGFPAMNFRYVDHKQRGNISVGEIIDRFNQQVCFIGEKIHLWREESYIDVFNGLPSLLAQTGFYLKILAKYHNKYEGELTILLNAPFIVLKDRDSIIKLLNNNPDRFKLPELSWPLLWTWSDFMDSKPSDFDLLNYTTFE